MGSIISYSPPPSCNASLLSLPADCRLAIILAGASHSAADRSPLRCFLLLCKDFCKLVLDNWVRIVEHYTVKMEMYTDTYYMFCGKVHRDNDLPAAIKANGTKMWYQHGKVHRNNDLPTVIYADGTQCWYQHDGLHRNTVCDLPAVIYADGTKEWWRHGRFIRRQ